MELNEPSGLYGLAVSRGASNQSILCVSMYPYRPMKNYTSKTNRPEPAIELFRHLRYKLKRPERNCQWRVPLARVWSPETHIYTSRLTRSLHAVTLAIVEKRQGEQRILRYAMLGSAVKTTPQEKPSVTVYPQFASRKLKQEILPKYSNLM
jgi:hypothetical protein